MSSQLDKQIEVIYVPEGSCLLLAIWRALVSMLSPGAGILLDYCCERLTMVQQRKGWDVLLKAFVSEFTASANVTLTIKASSFSAGG